jgi:hypothetical protein
MDRNNRRGRDRDDDREDDRSSRSSRNSRDDDRGGRSSGGRRGFEYKARDASSARKRADQGGKDFDSYFSDEVDTFKVSDGDNIIRILPPTWDDPEHYGLDIYVHYEIGADKNTYLCLNKMKNQPCPICEERARAQKDGDEEYAKKLEPKKRVLMYLIDRNNEKEGLKVWAAPWTVDRDVVKVSVDKRSGEVLPVDSPDEGYDIEFERHGKGNRTEYTGIAVSRRSSPLDNDKALDFAVENPLPSILKFYSYEHIETAFGGGSSSGGGRSSDDDRGGSSRDRDSRSGGSSRDRDDRGDRGRDSGSSSRGGDEDDLSWDQIHEMNYDELCDLIEAQRLDIDPDKSKNDSDLADWVCEEMKIEETKKPSRRSKDDDEDEDEGKGDSGRSDARDRLSRMRRGRD